MPYLLGTAALTPYTICTQITGQIHGLLASSLSFIFPLSNIAKEQGEVVRLRNVYFMGMNATTILAVAITLPVLIFAHPILSLWLGVEFADSSATLLQILAMMAMIKATSIVPYYYMNGTGYVRLNSLLGLLSGIFVAISAMILIPAVGLIGAALAQFAYIPVSVISRTILHYKILKDTRWYAGLLAFMPIVVSVLITYFLFHLEVALTLDLNKLAILSIGCSILGTILASSMCYLFQAPQKISV